jgi:hypothetical protein
MGKWCEGASDGRRSPRLLVLHLTSKPAHGAALSGHAVALTECLWPERENMVRSKKRGADVLDPAGRGFESVSYEETEHFRITSDFLTHREAYFRHLFSEEEEEANLSDAD